MGKTKLALFVVVLAGVAVVASASDAWATYSAPLTEVRIEETKYLHTPSIVRAAEQRSTSATDIDLSGWGAQYLGQYEWDFGFGLLVGVAGGYAEVDGLVGTEGQLGEAPVEVDTEGYWLGAQLRAYQMVWRSNVDIEVERPSALTLFVNVRTLFYDTSGQAVDQRSARLRFFTLTGGIGAMAEWSISDYISICPYAWLTPGVTGALNYVVGEQDLTVNEGFTLRNPFLVGLDIWVYTSPPNWTDHVSLSVLGSFVDTEGEDRTISVVFGYTF